MTAQNYEGLELPETGDAQFRTRETLYTIRQENGRWMLFGHFSPGSATPLITFSEHDGVWTALEVNGEGRTRHSTWQEAVRSAL